MKTYIKQVVFLLVLIGMVLFISACESGKPAASEAEMVSEIISRDNMIRNYNLQVDSSTISKRQTNTEQKTDYIWIDLNASNSDFSYSAEYCLEYALYNDGWLLEDYSKSNSSYEAKNYSSITIEQAEQEIRSLDYDQWKFEDRQELFNCVVFTYSASTNRYYQEMNYTVIITFTFTPGDSWDNVVHQEIITDTKWDIIGEWRYQDSQNDLYVKISDVDLAARKISLEYDLHTVIDRGIFYDGLSQKHQKSNGIITCPFTQYNDYSRVVEAPDDEEGSSIWVTAGQQGELDPGGEGCGVSFKGYWLTKQ